MVPANTLTDSRLARNSIQDLQALLRAGIESGDFVDAEPMTQLAHAFVRGAYARQLWRPAGTLIVGKVHKFDCFNFLMAGRMTIWSETEKREVVAPAFWVSSGGSKRVTYSHEDSLLITVHGTNERDLVALEAELVDADYVDDLLPESYKQQIGEIGEVVK